MPVFERRAVITSCNSRWARVRVRGLLRNAVLAGRLASAGVDPLQIQLDTGSVRVPLTPDRNEAFWVDWLSATAAAHFGDSPASPPRPAAIRRLPVPAPSSREARLAPSAPAAANGAVETMHSTPIDRLLANLGASAGLALVTRAFADAGAIGAVLAANATLGFVTERNAEETVSSLRKLAPRQATVVRDGMAVAIDAREVVAGDVLVLKPGEPAAAGTLTVLMQIQGNPEMPDANRF